MIKIGDTLISDDILEAFFVCDVEKCKGACCVEGDLGAPLEKEELDKLESNYEGIAPFLMEEGRAEIKRQGLYILDFEGDYSTPTIKGRECAYAIYDKSGIIKCGIEVAFEKGESDFSKPISCHLYPIRISKHVANLAVNYDQWHICDPACILGAELKVPVYQFLKDALVRKFGIDWYNQLDKYAKNKNRSKDLKNQSHPGKKS
jgi:hypothetical protein